MRSERELALLERANPVDESDLPAPEDTRARLPRDRILTEPVPRNRPRRRALRPALPAAGAAVATAAVVGALVLVGTPGGGADVEDAAAAVQQAAAVTAASAERSGTAVVRITHGDELWAEKTIRWNGSDLSLSDESPGRAGRTGAEFLLVDGMIYGIDPGDGRWVELGSPESIDPDSGTTPAEYLAATREDVGGAMLRRLTDAITGLATARLEDGSSVYSGSVAAGLVARESGFKEGAAIRVLPFGYVAHGDAADPAAAVDVALTVGADGLVRDVTATWGGEGGTWTYRVAYSDLGATPAPTAPADARPLLRDR
jgi:hypothetical protein